MQSKGGVIFELDDAYQNQIYTLQLALASATLTGLIGKDNSIARHGIHGLYWLCTFHGKNIMYLTRAKSDGHFFANMYDYIRLEGPRDT
ncbi:hypothetical protein Tsubulata_001275, partial [Turnera subulata]